MAKAVAINVGANKNAEWGGFRSPIFANGTFQFIHIPWKDHYGNITPAPKKYFELPYGKYVPANLRNKQVFNSPNFENKTYASTTNAPANKSLLSLNSDDYLFFYATLDFADNISDKAKWINPDWGAYLVGVFKVRTKYDSLKSVLSSREGISDFEEYAWYKIMRASGFDNDNAPWIKGENDGSGLLDTAIPLSDAADSQKWSDIAVEVFRTTSQRELNQKKKAVFQTVLTCEGENLMKLLSLCKVRKV